MIEKTAADPEQASDTEKEPIVKNESFNRSPGTVQDDISTKEALDTTVNKQKPDKGK